MLNSSTGIFSFQFSSMDDLEAMLEIGPWFIRKDPLILKKWNPDVNLLKEDMGNVSVWVKLHGVPVTAFSEDGLSAIATKLGTPLILDSYTSDMCMYSWGSMSGNPVGVRVVRCLVTSRRNVPRIQAWPTANTSDIKKKGVEPTKEGATSSGSSLWNVETSNINTTPIVEKIGKLEQLIIDGKCTLFDDDGKPLKMVDYPGDHDSDDEKDSYENGDYDEDPYDDDMYEGQDLPDKLQDICDSLDIRVRGRRKK
ncbi:hypothetical protein Tco_1126382 [Tanacetum coccineum]